MKNLKLIKLTLYLLSTVWLPGCVSDIPLDNVSGAEIPVVNCLLSNDTIQTLSITSSVKIDDIRLFREIRDARASLSSGGVFIGEFVRTGYGKWELNYQPVAGNQYELTVNLSDGTVLTASTTMPGQNDIQKNSTSDVYPRKNFIQKSALFPCWAFVLEQNVLPDNILHAVPSQNAYLHTELGTNHPLVDRFNEEGGLSSIFPETSTPAYNYYVRIKSSDIHLTKDIPFLIETNYGRYNFVCFRNASKEYDDYLKSSFQKLWLYSSEEDPIQWFDETMVFSNISNGVGIFGAYSDQYFFYF